MKISSEVEDEQKEQTTTAKIKIVSEKWKEIQNVAMKWNTNKSKNIRTADLFHVKFMWFSETLKKTGNICFISIFNVLCSVVCSTKIYL